MVQDVADAVDHFQADFESAAAVLGGALAGALRALGNVSKPSAGHAKYVLQAPKALLHIVHTLLESFMGRQRFGGRPLPDLCNV
jgi:hypothetical protein